VNALLSNTCRKLVIALCLVASEARAAGRDQGIFEIRVKDHREAIGDFAKLHITIEKIMLSPKPGLRFWQTAWKDLGAPSETIDLTKYVGNKRARVFRSIIDTGSFDAFHLKIRSIDALLKKTQRSVAVKNAIAPVKLSFDVPAKGETLLIVDLVVTDFSDHPPRGYELAIKGYELFTNDKLVHKVPPG
jgi:hypothetical protein